MVCEKERRTQPCCRGRGEGAGWAQGRTARRAPSCMLALHFRVCWQSLSGKTVRHHFVNSEAFPTGLVFFPVGSTKGLLSNAGVSDELWLLSSSASSEISLGCPTLLSRCGLSRPRGSLVEDRERGAGGVRFLGWNFEGRVLQRKRRKDLGLVRRRVCLLGGCASGMLGLLVLPSESRSISSLPDGGCGAGGLAS